MKNKSQIVREINDNNELMEKLTNSFYAIGFKKDKKYRWKSMKFWAKRLAGISVTSSIYVMQLFFIATVIFYTLGQHSFFDVIAGLIICFVPCFLGAVFNSFVYRCIFEEKEDYGFKNLFSPQELKEAIIKEKYQDKISYKDLEIISDYIPSGEMKILLSSEIEYCDFRFEDFRDKKIKERKEDMLDNIIKDMYANK